MFGNSQSYNNIFGNQIQESHQRMFGGDRMLSTKDIEGAQPRKYNRHVWGNYQPSPYQNILSFEPQKSTIKSTILGDNVQPLNRGIPNSSGMIFRDPQSQSLTQKLYTQQANPTNFRSPQSKGQQQEPTPKVSQIQPYTSVNDRKSIQNTLSFTNVMRDSKNQLYQAHSPSTLQKTVPDKSYGRRIEPPSQLREQNIFSLPDYTNKSATTYARPIVNLNQVPQGNEQPKNNFNVAEKMEKYKQMHNLTSGQLNQEPLTNKNIVNSNRSPDAYIPFEPTPKEYMRQSISSYALGQAKDPVVEKYLPNKEVFYQQPSKSPVFSQNRNYGPDAVLKGPLPVDNREGTSNFEFGSFASPRQKLIGEQGSNSPIKQEDNIRPSSNRPPSNRPTHQLEQNLNAEQQGFQDFRPKSNQNKYISEVEKLVSSNTEQPYQNKNLYDDKVLSQSQIPQRPPSNPLLLGRPASNYASNGYPNDQIYNGSQIQASQDTLRLRSVLSSRAKQLLNQKQIQQTANAEYGLYQIQSNRYAEPQKEKILYQSKRDNFLRSHLPRSQSAEGNRFIRGGQEDNQINQEQVSISSKQPNYQSNLPKYAQWGLRNYNIIGNYQQPYKYEGRKGDPFADIKYIGKMNLTGNAISNIKSTQNLTSNLTGNPQSPDINKVYTEPTQMNQQSEQAVQQIEFRKSGYGQSPVAAGVLNEYDETNRKFNSLYHKQKAQEQAQVKYYGVKALKNLSNIKLY